MAEGALGTNGDLDKNIQPEIANADGDAIPEEEQHQGDTLNGDIVPNSSSDADNSSQCQSADNSKDSNASEFGSSLLDGSDSDSADLTITESSSISKSREEKIRIARESYERERKRKIAEILEAQRQAEDFRLKQQEDRRRKIEEMRRKDQERRKTVEDRRRRMLELEEERRASLLRRSQARESRIDTMRSSRMPARMAMSCTFGSGEAALAAFSRPRVAFGSGTPREICRPIVVEPFPAILLNGGAGTGRRTSSAYHAGCLLSAHARSHRRSASAPSGSRSAARARRDMRTGYQPPRLACADSARSRSARPMNGFDSPTPSAAQRASSSVANLTPGRGARSASRGGTTTDSASRRQTHSTTVGQTRSASVTPSSSFMADKPGQVEKALNRRAGRSMDRKPAAKPTTPPDGNSGDTASSTVKLRSRSQGVTPSRPRPTSQVVTPAELDSVFARLAQPKRNLTASITAINSESPRGDRGASRDRRGTPPVTGPSTSSNKKRKKRKQKSPTTGTGKTPTPTASSRPDRASSTQRSQPSKEGRRLPSPPRPPAATQQDTSKEVPTSAASVDSGLSPSPQPIEKEGLDGLGILGPDVSQDVSEVSQDVEPVSEVSQDVEPVSEVSQDVEPVPVGVSAEDDTEEEDSDEEPVAFEPIPSIMTQSMPAVMMTASTKDMTEDEYRVRIAEQRRLVREKMERERQQKEEERQARAEQERLRRDEARQMAEEAHRRMQEEEERQRQEEELARQQEEERLRREEEERRQREEEERRQREQAEKERLERMAREEEERQARRARLERIMSRVKKPEDAPSPTPNPVPNPTPAPAEVAAEVENKETLSVEVPPAVQSGPASGTGSASGSDGRGQSPVGMEPASSTDSVSPPRKSASPAEAPKFKSALLQSMLAGGRLSIGGGASEGMAGLRRSSGSALSVLQAATGSGGSQDGVNVTSGTATAGGKGLAGPEGSPGMPHSFSMDALSAASRRDASKSSGVDGDAKCSPGPMRSSSEKEMSVASSMPNGDSDLCDEDEEVDSPALMSANIRTRLDEAKAAASRLDPRLENDNSRTAFEEILNLPPSTGSADRHLVAPVDPLPGVWFEQPSVPPQAREQTVISDLLS